MNKKAPSLPVSNSATSVHRSNTTITVSVEGEVSQTPIQIELCGYFREVLKPSDASQRAQKWQRVELSCAGEILTSDKVLEKKENADAERAAKRKK